MKVLVELKSEELDEMSGVNMSDDVKQISPSALYQEQEIGRESVAWIEGRREKKGRMGGSGRRDEGRKGGKVDMKVLKHEISPSGLPTLGS